MTLRILLIEDSEDDAALLQLRLEEDVEAVALRRVDTEEAMMHALSGERWDVIIADFSLPRFDGQRALELAQKRAPNIPFIAVSGTVGEERAVELMRLGAKDFVLKDKLHRLGPAIRRELADVEMRSQKRAAEREREELIGRLQAALEHADRLNSSLAEAIRTKDEFLATVSHELRTPLNAILGWTVMLQRRGLGPDVDRALAIVERNARAQAVLIEDVLDISRVTTGKLRLHLEATDVAETVRAAVETVRPAAQSKGVVVDAELPPTLGTLTADRDRLQQIVWNVLSNAVKFTPAGGRVRIAAERSPTQIVIRVSDTGEGIRPDHLHVIFEPFRQADGSTTRRHGGLGLGLSIVRQLVYAHGGTIRAASDGEGRGATFTIELPAHGTPPDAWPVASPPVADSARDAAALPLAGLRVLVVDDEEDARELLRMALAAHGADVSAKESGSAALASFEAYRPHVIVSDIGMPYTDGYTFLREVRALPNDAGGATPAIALTAYARGDDAARATTAGFQLHLTKPVDVDALVVAIAALAGRPV